MRATLVTSGGGTVNPTWRIDGRFLRTGNNAWLSAPAVIEFFASRGGSATTGDLVYNLPDQVINSPNYKPRRIRAIFETQVSTECHLEFNMVDKADQKTGPGGFTDVAGAVKYDNSRYQKPGWQTSFPNTNALSLNHSDGQSIWKCGPAEPIRVEITIIEGGSNDSIFDWRASSANGTTQWNTWGYGRITTDLEHMKAFAFTLGVSTVFSSFSGEIWQ